MFVLAGGWGAKIGKGGQQAIFPPRTPSCHGVVAIVVLGLYLAQD